MFFLCKNAIFVTFFKFDAMRFIRLVLFLLFVSSLFPTEAAAQTSNRKPAPQTTFSRKIINGKEFYLYRIEENDNINSVCIKFEVEPEIIFQYNPETKQRDTLSEGHLLLIPIRYKTAQISNAEKIFNHIVSSGETLYSLSIIYGVSVNRIIALNPEAEEVIHVGDTLRIPQNAVEGPPIQSQDAYIYHTIAAGETLYSLSKRYRTTVESIVDDNPGIDPHHLAIGEVIRIASNNKNIETKETPASHPQAVFYYTVKSKKETLESVARKFGTTPEEILAVNKGRNLVQKGNTVAIPKKEEQAVAPVAEEKTAAPAHRRAKQGGTYNVAVMLPFMTDREADVRSSLYTEFYEGFLLAADSMKRAGMSLRIYALDTRGSRAVVDSLIGTLAKKNLDLIIGPVENADIAAVAAFARQEGINMVNPFAVKNNEANRNPHVFQCNIPHESLYARSREKLFEEIGDKSVVFVIDDSGSENSKSDHIDRIKTKLLQEGKDFVEISLGQDPYMETFDEMLPKATDLFVLTNATGRGAVGKVVAPLAKLKDDKPRLNISLYGYPEWQMYIKEYIDPFCRLNTTIFSRFYSLPSDAMAAKVQDAFLSWFRKDMLQANPQHVFLGYDTGLFFLTALQRFGNDFENDIESVAYSGIQTCFRFRRINNWSGFDNEAILFVHFTPTFDITRETLLTE